MKRVAAAVAALFVVFSTSGSEVLAQAGDPRAVVQALVSAQNAGDVNAMLALIADNAVVTAPSGTAFAGKPRIQAWLQTFPVQRVRTEIVRQELLRPDTVEATLRISNEALSRLGVASFEFVADVVVKDGKIQYYSLAFTPESAERFRELRARIPTGAPIARAPAQLPRTGDLPYPALAPLGVVLLAAGLLLRARSSLNRNSPAKRS